MKPSPHQLAVLRLLEPEDAVLVLYDGAWPHANVSRGNGGDGWKRVAIRTAQALIEKRWVRPEPHTPWKREHRYCLNAAGRQVL